MTGSPLCERNSSKQNSTNSASGDVPRGLYARAEFALRNGSAAKTSPATPRPVATVIVSEEGGVFQIAKNLDTNSVKQNPEFLALVQSVLHTADS